MDFKARKLLSAGICAGALLLAASVEAAPVVFSGYTFETNGSAVPNSSSSKLQLTNTLVQAGSAFTALTLTNDGVTTPLQFDFTFQIGSAGTSQNGDGFAFVLQNDPRGAISLGGAGSDLGYGKGNNAIDARITPSLIVEFDSFSQPGETVAPHVAVQKNGDPSLTGTQASQTLTAPSFTDGAVWHSRIAIAGGTLSVYLDTTGAFATALLTTPMTDSLGNLLGVAPNGIFYAGFTGGTGGYANVQDILSFSDVAPVPLPAAVWLLLSGLGGLGAVARRRRRSSSAIAA